MFLPKALAALDGQRIVSCACGDTHTLCMAADGALWAFGRNSNGQLGNGGTDDSATPRLVEAMKVRRRHGRRTLWDSSLRAVSLQAAFFLVGSARFRHVGRCWHCALRPQLLAGQRASTLSRNR